MKDERATTGHKVTFGAEVSKWGPDAEIAGGLFAKCSCGWEHHYIPKAGHAETLLYIGLQHVTEAADLARQANE